MRHVQSAARVVETKTEAVAKGVNSAGAARGGVPLFMHIILEIAHISYFGFSLIFLV